MVNMPKSNEIYAYGCGTPIRQKVVEAMAEGANAIDFDNSEYPKYRGGHTIVWGLMRGAKELIDATRCAGHNYYQIDNAYFGRDIYFRVTKNGTQLTQLKRVDDKRYREQFHSLGLKLSSWKKKRGHQVLICASSPILYEFYNTSLDDWIDNTIVQIRKYTDRPIIVREKQLQGLEHDLSNSFILVTHVSASAIDALIYGVPIITTSACAATPLATPIQYIETPRITANRNSLFATLACGQFTIDEMKNGQAWSIVNSIL